MAAVGPRHVAEGFATPRGAAGAKPAFHGGDLRQARLDVGRQRVMLGSRGASDAHEFVSDLASRLRGRVQMTSDGYRPYLEAVEEAFGADIDYAMLVKLYGQDPENERPYPPAKCIGAIPTVITGGYRQRAS